MTTMKPAKEIQDAVIEEARNILSESKVPGEPGYDPIEAIRFAVLRYIERPQKFNDRDEAGNPTVGYGEDRRMHRDDMTDPEWWSVFPPIDGTRFRIFYDEAWGETPPTRIERTMLAVGATPVGVFEDTAGSYDSRGRLSAHYVLPRDAPIVNRLTSSRDD